MLFLLFTLFCSTPTLAAEDKGFVIPVAGKNEMPLALAKPHLPGGDPDMVADMIWGTVFHDLELTGYFKLLDPNLFLEQNKGVEPGTFSFSDWTEKPVSAHALVKIRVLPTGHADCDPGGKKMCVDVYSYYAISGEKLAAKRFRAPKEHARYLGHEAANVIVMSVTGESSIFGMRIAAVGSQGGNKEVFLMDIDGKGVTKVTRNGSINLSPAWSPDGKQIAWTSYRRGNPDLYVKNLVSGRARVVSNKLGINVSAAFSPDGKLALVRSLDGDSDIFIIDPDTGKELKRVTSGGGIDVSPSFSKDGSKLLYASERSGGSQVYLYDMNTGQNKRITYMGDFNTDPVFSPDGTKIAFVGRNRGFNVYVTDLEGGTPQPITGDMGDNEDPSWSPDGKYLLFSSTRSGRSEIWLSTIDGNHQIPITRSGGWTQPTWAPVEY